jgi:hypothetical protein
MRVSCLPFALLAIVLVGCPDSAPRVTTSSEVETLEQFVPAGIWVGKSANASACTVSVTHAASQRAVEIAVSLDDENLVNGVPAPIKDRKASSRFSLEVSGTGTQSFSVDEKDADVETTVDAAGRLMNLRAQKSPQGFAFIEVEETIQRVTTKRRCEGVVLSTQ